MSRVLKYKIFALIKKKNQNLSIDAVTCLNEEETEIQLELLETAFRLYNIEYKGLITQDDIGDKDADSLTEELYKVSQMYKTTKALLIKHIRRETIQSKPIDDTNMSNYCM